MSNVNIEAVKQTAIEGILKLHCEEVWSSNTLPGMLESFNVHLNFARAYQKSDLSVSAIIQQYGVRTMYTPSPKC